MPLFVIPAKAEIQNFFNKDEISAFAGMTNMRDGCKNNKQTL